MADTNIILKPRTYVREGFKVLDALNGSRPTSVKVDGIQVGTKFTVTKFTNATSIANGSIAVGEGTEGIYAESGVEFSYPGTLPAGAVFRATSPVDSQNAVVTLNKAHQFAYTFKNTGNDPIYLKLNQVNSGASIEPEDEGVELTLQPGEVKQFVITIEFTIGSANKNALSLFTVLKDTENMSIQMALSCKLGE